MLVKRLLSIGVQAIINSIITSKLSNVEIIRT